MKGIYMYMKHSVYLYYGTSEIRWCQVIASHAAEICWAVADVLDIAYCDDCTPIVWGFINLTSY